MCLTAYVWEPMFVTPVNSFKYLEKLCFLEDARETVCVECKKSANKKGAGPMRAKLFERLWVPET